MCTLLVATRLWPGTPLVVAANRDEKLDRASEAPRRQDFGGRSGFAPRDALAGGTWMGVNAAGLFVGITNRFVPGPTPGHIHPDRRSRGLAVHDALAASSRAAALAQVRRHGGRAHNPFHLVVADAEGASLIWCDGSDLHEEELAPGLHVLTERSRDAAPSGREDALLASLPDLSEASSLRSALAVHRATPFDSTCVHATDWNYGTRSASLVSWEGARPASFLYADGPSCVTPWQDLSAAMAEALTA